MPARMAGKVEIWAARLWNVFNEGQPFSIVYPLIVGEGKALFSSSARHAMELHKVEQLPGGRLSLVYGIGR